MTSSFEKWIMAYNAHTLDDKQPMIAATVEKRNCVVCARQYISGLIFHAATPFISSSVAIIDSFPTRVWYIVPRAKCWCSARTHGAQVMEARWLEREHDRATAREYLPGLRNIRAPEVKILRVQERHDRVHLAVFFFHSTNVRI